MGIAQLVMRSGRSPVVGGWAAGGLVGERHILKEAYTASVGHGVRRWGEVGVPAGWSLRTQVRI